MAKNDTKFTAELGKQGIFGREASIQNPALKPFSVLVGNWETVGIHPLFPGITFHGHTSFDWLEGGAFLIMHSEINEPGIPSGIAIFGSDETSKEFFMLYFDERGVSRKLEVTLHDNIWNGGEMHMASRNASPA